MMIARKEEICVLEITRGEQSFKGVEENRTAQRNLNSNI